MPILATKPNIQRTLVPKGTNIARVIGVIYMGTIQGEYMGSPLVQQKIRLTWEFPEELHVFKDGDEAKPLVHSEEYTLSMNKKSKLRPIIEGIIGVTLTDEEAWAFDVASIINSPCLVSISHKVGAKSGLSFAKVSSTSMLMKGQTCKESYNPKRVFDYAGNWDEEYFNKLPNFIKEKMMTSAEYKAKKGIKEEINPDEIPF